MQVGQQLALIVAVGTRACAIPLQHVAETMRPLAIEPMLGTPAFILGVSVVRGAPVPVVDLQALLENNQRSASLGRFVTVKAAERRVALGVDSIVGLRTLQATQLEELPPMLRSVRTDYIDAIGILDAALLLVLRAARTVPDEVWSSLAARREVAP